MNPVEPRPKPQHQGFLAGGGEMGALMRAHDWSTSPLGDPAGWPDALKTVVALMINSRYPMFVAWGPELAFLYNDGYRPIFGAKHPHTLGLPFKQVWAEIWDDILPLIERALAGEATFNEDLHLVMERNGYPEDTWYSFSYSPVRDENGAIAGMFCACTETTEQVLNRRRLAESEERFRLIADSAPVPIWVTMLDRRRSFVNRAYVDFVGLDYEAAVDFDWRSILHPDDVNRIIAESVAGEATLAPFTLEARYRNGDGEWRWLRSISQPRFGPNGEHIGFIGVAHDLTEWKEATTTLERNVAARTADLRAALDRLQAEVGERERAEEALRQAQKMEAVGRLTGGIAHDFNNLLTPVIGGLEIIAGSVADARLKRLADNALESSRRGAKLTTQLLAFSRTQRLSMAPVAVDQVIGNLRQILKHTIGPDIAIHTALEAGASALCDENQLENAIINLAINARDAMPEGGMLTISTALSSEPASPDLEAGDYVRITVSDTGHGMAPEVAARAIEPFFTTKPFGKGTGLGLAQVYGIAQQSGGGVRIESREAAGTTVQILLPRASAGAPDRDADVGSPIIAPGGAGAHILIVDDDAEVREFLAGALADLGHRVDSAPDAAAALSALETARPQLMLADFAMPGMNGAELARTARARHPGLPIIFVTGFAESEQLEGALADVPVLRKPFGLAQLGAAIRDALSESFVSRA